MKKALLISAGLLVGSLSASAQATNCGLAIQKSGTGLNRTYTLSVPTSVPNYYFSINPTSGVTQTGTGLTKSVTYTYGGYYNLSLEAPGSCTDSVYKVDTVIGPINCTGVYSYLSQSGTGATRSFNAYSYGAANTPGYTSSTTYNYGDGTSGTTASHTYTASGTYTVTATSVFTHPTYPSCTKTASTSVNVSVPGAFNCANVNASFTTTNSGATYTFTNTSTNTNNLPVVTNYYWSINGTSFASGPGNKTYTFTSNGTYTVMLYATWNSSGNGYCTDSTTQTITVTGITPPAPANQINAYVGWDSTLNASGASVKLWLIKYDSATQVLSAVDSALVSAPSYPYVSHTFNNKPAGSYRLKAHMLNQPASWTTGLLPTYAQNAAYWQNATVINHSGGTTYSGVLLQQGTPTTGPGFVGGSVVQGANRSTAMGDPIINATVLLRDASGNPVASAMTDAQGRYQFQNIPVGTYTVYPEELNFSTIPSSTITIASGSNPSYDYNFRRNSVDREFVPFITPAAVKTTQLSQFNVYPNPSQGKLTVECPANQSQVEMKLVNMLGAVVFSTNLQSGTNTIELPQLAEGAYQLILQNNSIKENQLLLLQH